MENVNQAGIMRAIWDTILGVQECMQAYREQLEAAGRGSQVPPEIVGAVLRKGGFAATQDNVQRALVAAADGRRPSPSEVDAALQTAGDGHGLTL
eukprot:1466662-Amphidinium_carterae.1